MSWFALAFCCMLFCCFKSILAKHLLQTMNSSSFTFLDQVFAILFMLPWVTVKTFAIVDFDFWLLLVSMIVPTILGLIYLSKATKYGELSEVSPLLIFLPVLVALSGPWFQDERLSGQAWLGISIVGLGGYCLKLESLSRPLQPLWLMLKERASRYVWVTVILGVWTTHIQRLMVQAYSAEASLFFTSLGVIVGMMPFIFMRKGAVRGFSQEIFRGGFWLILLGLVSSISAWSQLAAYSHGGNVATVLSIKRLSIILISFYGIAIMNESLRFGKILGIVIMTIGGLVIFI